jgi:hypothetical protein
MIRANKPPPPLIMEEVTDPEELAKARAQTDTSLSSADGFGGEIYAASAGLTAHLLAVSRANEELERFAARTPPRSTEQRRRLRPSAANAISDGSRGQGCPRPLPRRRGVRRCIDPSD